MILSSADIQRILGGDPVIRQEARISIVDTKPGLGLDEYVYIYIERYPTVDEFEATWRIWVQDGGSDVLDLVLAALTRLLPRFEFQAEGLYSTTDFKSDRTVVRPAEEIALERVAQATGTIEQRLAALEKTILARLATVRDGIDGQDGLNGLPGAPGAPGRDGRDGRDLVATEANLEDLQNVEQNIAKEDGQVLTWRNGVWQNLFIPQIISTISASGGVGTAGGGGLSLLGSGAWRYSSSTAGDPASSRIQFDNADPSLAAFAYVSRYNNENKDIYNLFPALVTTGTLLYIQGGDADNYYLYEVTADTVQVGGTHLQVSIALVTEGADSGFSNNEVVTLGSYSTTPGGGGVEEAPLDGAYYVRQNGQWVNLADALLDLQEQALDDLDAGDFTTSVTNANNSTELDAGDFTTGTATTTVTTDFDGGDFSP